MCLKSASVLSFFFVRLPPARGKSLDIRKTAIIHTFITADNREINDPCMQELHENEKAMSIKRAKFLSMKVSIEGGMGTLHATD